MYQKKRKIRLILLVFLFCSLLFSCSSKEAKKGSVLIVGVESNPTNLDPRLAIDIASLHVIDIVYNKLVKKDKHSNIIPDLATHWENPDDLTYIFHLKKGVNIYLSFKKGGQVS